MLAGKPPPSPGPDPPAGRSDPAGVWPGQLSSVASQDAFLDTFGVQSRNPENGSPWVAGSKSALDETGWAQDTIRDLCKENHCKIAQVVEGNLQMNSLDGQHKDCAQRHPEIAGRSFFLGWKGEGLGAPLLESLHGWVKTQCLKERSFSIAKCG